MKKSKSIARAFYAILFVANFFLLSCNSGTETKKNETPAKSDTVVTKKTDPLFKKYNLENIQMPAGFHIEVFAEIPSVRSLCVSPDGTVFAGTRNDKVFAVSKKSDTSKAEVYQLADGLSSPNGVAFAERSLYIGASSTIYKMENIESRLGTPSKPVVLYNQFPSDKHHGLRYIRFGPDGKLYVAVGAPCNVCVPSKPIYATITRINRDGTGFEIYASGVRNSVGFDWDPSNHQLYFTDNGCDNMGDDIPNDELNMAAKPGMNFGFPYCHQGSILDPAFGVGKKCNEFTPPVKLLGAHVAALGMRFNTGSMFPDEYKNAIFIAEHGSWNRSIPDGYRIAVIKRDSDGNLGQPEVFAKGWLQKEKEVNGRPVDVQFLSDGSMLVSDDYNGVIYRIYYKK